MGNTCIPKKYNLPTELYCLASVLSSILITKFKKKKNVFVITLVTCHSTA